MSHACTGQMLTVCCVSACAPVIDDNVRHWQHTSGIDCCHAGGEIISSTIVAVEVVQLSRHVPLLADRLAWRWHPNVCYVHLPHLVDLGLQEFVKAALASAVPAERCRACRVWQNRVACGMLQLSQTDQSRVNSDSCAHCSMMASL
jgi:hypothetical protein